MESFSNAGSRIVGTYRTWPIVLGGLVALILTGGLGYSAAMTFTGSVVDKQTGTKIPASQGIGFALFAFGCAVVLGYCVLAFANDRIVIDGDHLSWRDKLGRKRVDCTSRDIVPFSFSAWEQYTPRGSAPYARYRAMTRMGPVRFDSNMSNSSDIARWLEQMSNLPHRPDSAPAKSDHWTGDPLSD
ncbi:MAG TPA: hypothetical protein VMI31_05195 [Fimbriimonadaceae bacterium]|nr:hypothetical protein [Fimbriimonadaceae bacterium]